MAMTNLKTPLFAALLLATASVAAASPDSTTTWTVQEFPIAENITGIDFFCEDTAYAVTSGGVIARTFDAGNHWIGRRITQTPLEDLQFIDGPVGWVIGQSGLIWKTKDGGLNWENQSYGDTAAWLLDIQMLDRSTGIIIGATREKKEMLGGLLLRTIDGGEHWNKIDVGGLGYSEIVTPNDSTVAFLAYGALYTSHDKGATWKRTLTFDGYPCRCLSILGSAGIMGGSSGTTAYSRDGGATWTESQQSQGDLYIACQLVNQSVGYMGGQGGKFRKTLNGGSIWFDESLPIDFDIFDMQLVGPKLYIVGSKGSVVVGDVIDRTQLKLKDMSDTHKGDIDSH